MATLNITNTRHIQGLSTQPTPTETKGMGVHVTDAHMQPTGPTVATAATKHTDQLRDTCNRKLTMGTETNLSAILANLPGAQMTSQTADKTMALVKQNEVSCFWLQGMGLVSLEDLQQMNVINNHNIRQLEDISADGNSIKARGPSGELINVTLHWDD